MKRTLFLLVFLHFVAVHAGQPWRLSLTSPKEGINLVVDLYEESIEVPTLEDFGPMNGYMDGNIYGVWYVTSFKLENDKMATIKLANDLGSEIQKIQLTQTTDSTWQMKFLGTNVVRRVAGKKLVKVPDVYQMRQRRP